MLAHPRAHDQIAAGGAEGAGASLVRHPDLRAGVDPRRDRHVHPVDGAAHAAAETGAAPARADRAAGAAVCAGREALDVRADPRTPRHLGERQLHDGVGVVAATSRIERVARAHRLTEPIVHGTRGRIGEHSVRLGDLVEERPGLRVPEVDVRRVLPREPLVRPADLARRSRSRDAQHRVVVAPHHAPTSFSRPDPRSRHPRPRPPSARSGTGSAALRARRAGPAPGPRGT